MTKISAPLAAAILAGFDAAASECKPVNLGIPTSILAFFSVHGDDVRQLLMELSEPDPPALTDVHTLANACHAVLSHRYGGLPTHGWLRDTPESRKALASLAELVLNVPARGSEGAVALISTLDESINFGAEYFKDPRS